MIDRNLHNLFIKLGINTADKVLQKMTLDSRKVTPGDLFLAIKGHQTDGRRYVSQAIEKGAIAIIAESQEKREIGTVQYKCGVPHIYINNLINQLSFLAGEFYKHPGEKLKLIGVTGTNGKTTITQLIAQWAKGLGEISAVMGTFGIGLLGETIPSENTTVSAIDIQSELQLLLEKQATFVAMEVSSHALVQSRVANIPFTAAIFSNLSRDHFDYHGDMQNYESAKWLLFSTHKSNKQIINVDDDTGLRWLKRLPLACAVSIKNRIPRNFQGPWMLVERIDYNDYQTTIYFNSTWGRDLIKSPLIGVFNINNVMLAMATLLMMGYLFDQVIKSSVALQPVCGRMEIFRSPGRPIIIIDYAHTPDALEKALVTVRNLNYRGKLWCVFGCGGDRDKGKRALMGSIAEQYADFVIITNDNPRNEEPKTIINDILSGFFDINLAIPIIDRIEAITSAIIRANNSDIILIVGKGHENYQIIGNQCIDYSDRMTVRRLLGVIR
ncbi:MAG: UDP-N-acetylmuramoyl-L-alanyl-D-glutamate--2,6-diaminopimelate ligase [Arsenophonus sp. ET-DL9-MAG3]